MITKYQLTHALFTGGPLTCGQTKLLIVNAVAREDGSGHCFNVTGFDHKQKERTVFVRTVD